MTPELLTLLAQLVPPAAVVAWSPVKILPPLALVFAAARRRVTSLAYLAGSLVSLVAATVLFITTPRLLSGFHWSGQGTGAWFRLGLGLFLILHGGYVWTRRGRNFEPGAWVSGLSRITPTAAALLAISLTVLNPKVMIATAAAGLAIGGQALATAGTVAAVAVFTALAGSTIIVPVLGYVIAAERVDALLIAVRHKVEQHQAAVTAAVLAAVGAGMVATGLVAV